MKNDDQAEFWVLLTYRGKPNGERAKVKYSLRALFTDRDTSTEYGVYGIRAGHPVRIEFAGDDECVLVMKPEAEYEFRIMKDRFPYHNRRVPYEMELGVQVFREKAAAQKSGNILSRTQERA
jgi:hypothetical protein